MGVGRFLNGAKHIWSQATPQTPQDVICGKVGLVFFLQGASKERKSEVIIGKNSYGGICWLVSKQGWERPFVFGDLVL